MMKKNTAKTIIASLTLDDYARAYSAVWDAIQTARETGDEKDLALVPEYQETADKLKEIVRLLDPGVFL